MAWKLSLVLFAACTTGADLELVENQQPLEDCSLSDDRTGEPITEGTFDLAVGARASYMLTALVRNRTPAPMVVTTARVRAIEPDTDQPLRVRCGGDVCLSWDLDLCDRGRCPEVPANSTASFEVPAMDRIVSGFYQAQMDLAVLEGRNPPEFDIDAEVQLIAGDIVSPPFIFPIHLCLGCLVTFPDEADLPRLPGPDCCGPSFGDDGCYPGQDSGFSCGLCTSSLPEICNFGRRTCE